MNSDPTFAVNGISYRVDLASNHIHNVDDPLRQILLPRLKMQEIPYDADASVNRFQPSNDKPFIVTNGAGVTYGPHVIHACLFVLQQHAKRYDGLDYLQVFEDTTNKNRHPLWFIEHGEGGAITALLPSDY